MAVTTAPTFAPDAEFSTMGRVVEMRLNAGAWFTWGSGSGSGATTLTVTLEDPPTVVSSLASSSRTPEIEYLPSAVSEAVTV